MGSLCADRETKGSGALQDSRAWAAGLKVRAGLYILAGRMSSDSRISMCDKMSRKDRLAVDCNLNSIIRMRGARENSYPYDNRRRLANFSPCGLDHLTPVVFQIAWRGYEPKGPDSLGTRHRYTSRPLQLNPDIDARSSNQARPGGCIDLNGRRRVRSRSDNPSSRQALSGIRH